MYTYFATLHTVIPSPREQYPGIGICITLRLQVRVWQMKTFHSNDTRRTDTVLITGYDTTTTHWVHKFQVFSAEYLPRFHCTSISQDFMYNNNNTNLQHNLRSESIHRYNKNIEWKQSNPSVRTWDLTAAHERSKSSVHLYSSPPHPRVLWELPVQNTQYI